MLALACRGVGRVLRPRTGTPARGVRSPVRCLATDADAPRPRVLVLGGSGFVGAKIARLAAASGFDVSAVSRRGWPAAYGESEAAGGVIDWVAGDATDPALVRGLLSSRSFAGVVHAIGMLFESPALNVLVSGSQSRPGADASYERITRQTAFHAIAAACESLPRASPFVFVSAAEAGWAWDPPTPGDFLRRYLVAKRAVEAELESRGEAGALRPVILRPSIIYTPGELAALPAVAAFTAGNALGLPFVDRPVTVGTVVAAAVAGLRDERVRGVLRFRDMEALAATGR